jgi:hypothetical protein
MGAAHDASLVAPAGRKFQVGLPGQDSRRKFARLIATTAVLAVAAGLLNDR